MTKRNHRRNYTAPRFYDGQKSMSGFITWHGHGETVLSGKRVNASSSFAAESSRGVARDKAGAKKYVRSRTRYHEDAALARIIRDKSYKGDV